DRHALAVAVVEVLQAGLEALDSGRGAVDVGADPGAARAVTEAPQPQRHRRQGVVAREEAGDEEDGLAVAVRDAHAGADRVAPERAELGGEAGFAPEWGNRVHRIGPSRSGCRLVRTPSLIHLIPSFRGGNPSAPLKRSS